MCKVSLYIEMDPRLFCFNLKWNYPVKLMPSLCQSTDMGLLMLTFVFVV